MILTGPEIQRCIEAGEIHIEPFDKNHLGPNSYDVTLNPLLRTYSSLKGLDMKSHNPTHDLMIDPDGTWLYPGHLYLGMTNETAVSDRYVPMLEGRSSIGRLGINIHSTAGFGDIGWGYRDGVCLKPTWTLEITVVTAVRVYPNVKIGQVYFMQPRGELKMYNGKYSDQHEPQASMSHKDFEGREHV